MRGDRGQQHGRVDGGKRRIVGRRPRHRKRRHFHDAAAKRSAVAMAKRAAAVAAFSRMGWRGRGSGRRCLGRRHAFAVRGHGLVRCRARHVPRLAAHDERVRQGFERKCRPRHHRQHQQAAKDTGTRAQQAAHAGSVASDHATLNHVGGAPGLRGSPSMNTPPSDRMADPGVVSTMRQHGRFGSRRGSGSPMARRVRARCEPPFVECGAA